MRGVLTVLLIGVLSMLFAEVFSGASQMWYIDIGAILLAFFLYLGHVVFLLYIALKNEKTSIPALYILGMIFGLYEAWVTKVLWAGYMNSAGPSGGTILGISTMEFPILVLFWHSIMAFILPILVYQILSKTTLSSHKELFRKTKWKTILGIVLAASFSTFIATNNGFNFFTANMAVIGTVLIAVILTLLVKPRNIRDVELSKKGFIVASVYIASLYIITFFILLPERIPTTILPYISILIFYIIFIWMFVKSKKSKTKIVKLTDKQYGTKDLIYFLILILLFTNLSLTLPAVTNVLLVASYLIFIFIGIIFFIITLINIIRKKF